MIAPLQVTVERDGATARLIVAGEIDLSTADRFREALRAELDSARRVLIDLARCTFIDSVGLSVLVEASGRRFIANAPAIGIVSPSEPVRRLIELTQLESLIPVLDSEAGAPSDEPLSA
jgi:anti-anti-sigma factor